MTNVERHAGATRMSVTVTATAASLSLAVEDDGRGIEVGRLAAAARAGHLGHVGLRRRTEDLGGKLQIDAPPGNGCRVRVSLEKDRVHEYHLLQEALHNERSWNAALVSGFPHPFVVCTLDLRLVEVSDRFVRLTGWSRSELLGAPAGELPHWPPESRAGLRRLASSVVAARERTVEAEIVCRDGRRLRVSVTACVVRDPRGDRELRLVTYTEIAEVQRGRDVVEAGSTFDGSRA